MPYYSLDKENIIYYKLDNYYAPSLKMELYIMTKIKNKIGLKKNNSYLKKDRN